MHRTAARMEHPSRKRSNATVTILVIEDERFVCDVTCEILRDAGYRVLRAECAAAARTMFLRGERKIHLLLCDAVLPDGSGVALSQALRQRSPGLKVVMASGYPAVGSGGGHDLEEFLAKPYDAAALITKVKTVLQGAA